MRVINLYVEGQGDLVFIGNFLAYNFNFEFQFSGIHAKSVNNANLEVNLSVIAPSTGHGGMDNKKIRDLIKEIKTSCIPIGIECAILIDADTPKHKNPIGGFDNRKAYLLDLIQQESIDFFIIPNHNDDGNLENILEKIISPNGKPFYNCLSNYVSCLSSLENDAPNYIKECDDLDKEKLRWYTYMMLGKSKDIKRDYLDKDLWDLTNAALVPLNNFFKKIFP